jgi:hypothetical protein
MFVVGEFTGWISVEFGDLGFPLNEFRVTLLLFGELTL